MAFRLVSEWGRIGVIRDTPDLGGARDPAACDEALHDRVPRHLLDGGLGGHPQGPSGDVAQARRVRRTHARLAWCRGVLRQARHSCRHDGYDFDGISAQPAENAVPLVDELSQLPPPVFGHDAAELRMVLQPIDSANQLIDDLRGLFGGVAPRQLCLEGDERQTASFDQTTFIRGRALDVVLQEVPALPRLFVCDQRRDLRLRARSKPRPTFRTGGNLARRRLPTHPAVDRSSPRACGALRERLRRASRFRLRFP